MHQLLEEDVRNNSAWNQRHFTITQTTGFTKEVIQREVEYTKAAITKVVDNESPWSYLRGLVNAEHRLGFVGCCLAGVCCVVAECRVKTTILGPLSQTFRY